MTELIEYFGNSEALFLGVISKRIMQFLQESFIIKWSCECILLRYDCEL